MLLSFQGKLARCAEMCLLMSVFQVRFNLLQYVVPEVKELYNWLEVDFHPLKLSGRVTKVNTFFLICIHVLVSTPLHCVLTDLTFLHQVLDWVREQAEKEPDLQQYVPHLQNNTILRLLQQVPASFTWIPLERPLE